MTDKIEQFWRDATAADIAKVMRGEQLQARFRDKCVPYWTEHYLCGVNGRHWIAGNFRWDLCQVYDPPQWYLDKPDPGEGWRLLEKFPDERLEIGDYWWDGSLRKWSSSNRAGLNLAQDKTIWYRRRIEPVPQAVGSRSKDNIPSGWQKIPDDEPRLASDAYWSLGAKDWVIIGDSRVEYANRDKWPAIRLSAKCEQPEPQTDTAKTSNSSVATQPANLPALKLGDAVMLPNGQTIRITESGFEVF